jgi:hypothetical protein
MKDYSKWKINDILKIRVIPIFLKLFEY